MKIRQIPLIFIALLCMLSNAYAAEVSNLYTANVPVASQSTSDQQQGFVDGLKQVLIKVTGYSQTLQDGVIKQALQHPANYIQQFSYQQKQVLDGDSLLMLQTIFEPKAINDLINQSGQTRWGRNRPLLLVWMAMKNQTGNIDLVGTDTQNLAHELFKQDASNRGLPTLFPMLDLTDMQHISAAQVFNANTMAVSQASLRYAADAIVLTQLQQNPDNSWQGSWQLLSDNQQYDGTYKADTLDDVILGMINNVTDTLAANYSVNSNTTAAANILLTVTSIDNLNNYAKVTKYVNNLTPVKSVEVAEVGSHSITLNLTVIGGEAALMKALSLDHTLKAVPDVFNQSQQVPHLTYQWML